MTSLYTRIASGLLFPLHERLKGHASVALHRGLEESQWWPQARLDAARVEKLRGFLARIGATVPYYREVFDQRGFDPAAVTDLRDLQALPFLTKPLIRSHVDALKAEGHGPLTRYNTGGS